MEGVVLPELGGRLISLRDRGREFLWHDPALLDGRLRRRVPIVLPLPGDGMSAWQNWGGDKSWPAPQAGPGVVDGWAGPPDAVLDGGSYEVVGRTDDGVVLRSAIDPRTGLEQTRSIDVDGRGVRVVTTITNRGAAAVRFAPWEVMQVAVADEDVAVGFVEVALGPGGKAVDLGIYRGRLRTTERGSGVRVGFGEAVGKLGFVGATGRVRCAFADGAELALAFAPAVGAPHDAPFQLWMQAPVDEPLVALDGWRPAHRLIELEPVGALANLVPGASASLTACWSVGRSSSRGSR